MKRDLDRITRDSMGGDLFAAREMLRLAQRRGDNDGQIDAAFVAASSRHIRGRKPQKRVIQLEREIMCVGIVLENSGSN